MSRRVLSVVGSLVVLIAMTAPPAPAVTRIVDRIIARVNNEIITQRQFDQEKEKLRAQLAQEYSGAELDTQFREQSKNLLRDLIDQSLMVQKASDLDINVDTDVIKRLDEIRQQYGMASLEQLQKEVEKQGIIWEDFKDQIKRQLLMREVIGREVGSRIIISRDDARKYYDAHKDEFKSPGIVHMEEILVSTQKHKPDEAKQRAGEALAEINAGQRFSDVAKKYSDGPNADKGGDIGMVKMGTMAPEIATAIAKLDVNQTTGIIDTKFGPVILKLVERFSPGIPKFDEVEQRIEEILYNQKMQPGMRDYLRELRKESYIYLAPGYIDTGAERTSDQLAKSGQ
jgi:peptidyl-prolyl cis-trans isomerase SurA